MWDEHFKNVVTKVVALAYIVPFGVLSEPFELNKQEMENVVVGGELLLNLTCLLELFIVLISQTTFGSLYLVCLLIN